MQERRKAKRHTLIYYMRAFDVRTRNLLGYLVDIAEKGAMLLCDDPVPVGETFRIKLELTEDIANKPFLEMTARSIWCHPDIDPHFYNAGFEIIEIAPEGKEVIDRIIDTYGLQEQRRAISNRPTEPPQAAKP